MLCQCLLVWLFGFFISEWQLFQQLSSERWGIPGQQKATLQRTTTIYRSPIPQKHSYGSVRKMEKPHRQRENLHTHKGIQTGFGNHRTVNHKAQSVRVKEEKGARKESTERGEQPHASWMEIRVCYPEDRQYI